MTLYEILKRNANRMLFSLVQDRKPGFLLFFPFTDDNGIWREQYLRVTNEKATEIIKEDDAENNLSKAESEGWHYVGVWHPPAPKPYEIGDPVVVVNSDASREYARRFHRTDSIHQCLEEFIDKQKVLFVIGGNDYSTAVKYGGNDTDIPSHLLIPYIQIPEAGEEQAVEECEKACDTPITREEVRQMVREELALKYHISISCEERPPRHPDEDDGGTDP